MYNTLGRPVCKYASRISARHKNPLNCQTVLSVLSVRTTLPSRRKKNYVGVGLICGRAFLVSFCSVPLSPFLSTSCRPSGDVGLRQSTAKGGDGVPAIEPSVYGAAWECHVEIKNKRTRTSRRRRIVEKKI